MQCIRLLLYGNVGLTTFSLELSLFASMFFLGGVGGEGNRFIYHCLNVTCAIFHTRNKNRCFKRLKD